MSDPAAEALRHVVLWGADHPDLGELAVEELPPVTAVALSAGRLPKPYAHLDDNEDAVLAAEGPAGTLLVAADGHSGFDAAAAAVAAIAQRLDVLARVGVDPTCIVDQLLASAQQGVVEALREAAEQRALSRTALSVALVTPTEATLGGWGDTQVLRVRGRRTKVLSPDSDFLDAGAPPAGAKRVKLKGGDVVLVCSDGLRDYLEGGWPSGVPPVVNASEDPRSAAQALIEAAFSGGAGDHLSVALTQAG